MHIVLGLTMLGTAITIIRLARPRTDGALASFARRPGMANALALLFTTLVAFGVTLVVSGIAQLAG